MRGERAGHNALLLGHAFLKLTAAPLDAHDCSTAPLQECVASCAILCLDKILYRLWRCEWERSCNSWCREVIFLICFTLAALPGYCTGAG